MESPLRRHARACRGIHGFLGGFQKIFPRLRQTDYAWHGVEGSLGAPPSVSNHGDSTTYVTLSAELDARVNTWPIFDNVEVAALDGTAEYRASRDRGVEHPRQLRVN